MTVWVAPICVADMNPKTLIDIFWARTPRGQRTIFCQDLKRYDWGGRKDGNYCLKCQSAQRGIKWRDTSAYHSVEGYMPQVQILKHGRGVHFMRGIPICPLSDTNSPFLRPCAVDYQGAVTSLLSPWLAPPSWLNILWALKRVLPRDLCATKLKCRQDLFGQISIFIIWRGLVWARRQILQRQWWVPG